MRILLLAIVLISCARVFAVESALVRLNEKPETQQIRVTTFAGEQDGTLSTVVPAPELTVALFRDTLLPGEIDEIKLNLTALYAEIKQKRNLIFALVTSNGTERYGPFAARSQMQTALRALLDLPDNKDSVPAVSDGLKTYELLGSLTPSSCGWASLLVIGHFPVPDPDLSDYTAAYLSNRFRAACVRVSYWAPGETNSSMFNAIADETGGIASLNAPVALVGAEDNPNVSWAELKWAEPVLKSGFHLHQAVIQNVELGGDSLRFSSFARANDFRIPALSRYRELRERAASLSLIRQKGALKPEELLQARQLLDEARAINPSDRETLAVAADIFELNGALEEAAAYLSAVCDLFPENGDLFARLGDIYFLARNYRAAETSLMRARKLRSQGKFVSKELGIIASTKGDDRKAISFLEESLKTQPQDAETWFLRAASANRLKDQAREAESLERGLMLQPGELTHRTSLVQLYIGRGEKEKAVRYIQPVLKDPPPDPTCSKTTSNLE